MKRLYTALPLCALVIGLFACGGGNKNSMTRGAGRTTINITWPSKSRAIPQNAQFLRITAYINGVQVGYDTNDPNHPGSAIVNPTSTTAVIAGLPVGQPVALDIKAFRDKPNQVNGAPQNDDVDANNQFYIGSATPPPFTVKPNDPNTVTTEVFSSIDHVKTLSYLENSSIPADPNVAIKPNGVYRIEANAYGVTPPGAQEGSVIVTSNEQWAWSRIDGSKPTPLLLSPPDPNRSTPVFDPRNGAVVTNHRIVYCQGASTLNAQQAGGLLQVTNSDTGKKYPASPAYTFVSTGSTLASNITGQRNPSNGCDSLGKESQQNTGFTPDVQASSRAAARTAQIHGKTRDVNQTSVYIMVAERDINQCNGTTFYYYYRIYKARNFTDNATAGKPLAQIPIETRTYSESLSDDPNPKPKNYGVSTLLVRNSNGIIAAIRQASPQSGETVLAGVTQRTYDVTQLFRFKQNSDGTLTPQFIQYPTTGNFTYTPPVSYSVQSVLDIHVAPATTVTSNQLTYVLQGTGSNYSILAIKDSDGSLVSTIPVSSVNPKRVTVDEDLNLYLIDGSNNITKYVNNNFTYTEIPFLFDATTQTFTSLEDIYYDGGLIYVLDTNANRDAARIGIFTYSGLDAGNSFNLMAGAAGQLDLTAGTAVNHKLNQSKRIFASGTTLFVGLEKSTTESFDPVAAFPLL